MFRPFLHIALLGAGILLGSHAALAESRMALVIGQSAYRAVMPLPNPANDAKAMTQLLGDAGFEVVAAPDLSQNDLRQAVGEFAAKMAAKGPDTVALVFYAGHGMQIDGENFLVPVDVDPKREGDIALQAVRLNDMLNTLTSVPSKMRIILLDACRNNPFPDLNKIAGQGLALVDAKIGAAGTFVSYSTSPGAVAEDGNGADSPYTTALLLAAREPGLSIEDAFKRVRVSVNKATGGRQTPWESSSLTDEFRFFAGPNDGVARQSVPKRTVDDWRGALQGKQPEAANELIVADGTVEAYEAFVGMFAHSPFDVQARLWLDRHRRMVAWNNAIILNTAVAYRAFLSQYPDSDLTATALKLENRVRNRPDSAAVGGLQTTPGSIAASQGSAQSINVSLAPTCPCGQPVSPPSFKKKADLPPSRQVEPDPPKRRFVTSPPPLRFHEAPPDDVVVYRRPPMRDYEPSVAPYIGGIIGGVLGASGGGRPEGGYGGSRTNNYAR